MPYCGEATLLSTGTCLKCAATLLCRAWTCPECGERRRTQLFQELKGGEGRIFITLTHKRRPGEYPAEAAEELAHAWRRFRRAEIKRRGWKDLPFMAVFEATQTGWPHLHILARCGFIDQKRLSDFMREACGSPIVFIRKVESAARGAAYLAAYIKKAPAKFGKFKRYWRSKAWDLRTKFKPKIQLEPGAVWAVSKSCIITIAENLYMQGWAIAWDGNRRIRAERPP